MTEKIEEILLRELTGIATPQEIRLLKEWIAASEENKDEYMYLKMLWQARKVELYSKDEVLSASFSEFNKRIRNSGKATKNVFLPLTVIFKYAAIFLVVLTAGFLFWYLGTNNKTDALQLTINTTSDIQQIILPDSTKVWLNENSTLKYPSVFNDKKRIVSLSGEGLFEVKKDPGHPFHVLTEYADVEVTGTTFNVKTSDKSVQAVLVEGQVTINDLKGNRIVKLQPGQMSYTPSSGKTIVKQVNVEDFTYWKNGLVKFNEASIIQILDKVEQIYKVDLVYDSARLAKDDSKYNFVIRRSQSFDTIFDMLEFVAPPAKSIKVKKLENHIK